MTTYRYRLKRTCTMECEITYTVTSSVDPRDVRFDPKRHLHSIETSGKGAERVVDQSDFSEAFDITEVGSTKKPFTVIFSHPYAAGEAFISHVVAKNSSEAPDVAEQKIIDDPRSGMDTQDVRLMNVLAVFEGHHKDQ